MLVAGVNTEGGGRKSIKAGSFPWIVSSFFTVLTQPSEKLLNVWFMLVDVEIILTSVEKSLAAAHPASNLILLHDWSKQNPKWRVQLQLKQLNFKRRQKHSVPAEGHWVIFVCLKYYTQFISQIWMLSILLHAVMNNFIIRGLVVSWIPSSTNASTSKKKSMMNQLKMCHKITT